jgi:hypothetical protein
MRKETDSYGTICYYNDLNQYHREDGPAIEYANGTKWWYLNDQLHREDGPAVEWDNGDRSWHLNSQRHREDGPAIERANGSKSWYFRDKRIDCETNEEFLKLMKLKAFW